MMVPLFRAYFYDKMEALFLCQRNRIPLNP